MVQYANTCPIEHAVSFCWSFCWPQRTMLVDSAASIQTIMLSQTCTILQHWTDIYSSIRIALPCKVQSTAMLTCRLPESNFSLALHSPHCTSFFSRLPLTVNMSPKYVELDAPQLGQLPCKSAFKHALLRHTSNTTLLLELHRCQMYMAFWVQQGSNSEPMPSRNKLMYWHNKLVKA